MCALAAATAADKAASAKLSVFVTSKLDADSSPRFSVSLPGVETRLVSAAAERKRRPLVLVVDPGSYGQAEIRRRIAALGRALASSTAAQEPGPLVRLGFPVLDGVLSPPLRDRKTLIADLDKEITTYLPEEQGERSTFGRVLDLVVDLAEKAEKEGGPIDCLLLFRDHAFDGEDAAYLNLGMERRFGDFCARQGSTFHGWLEGAGILRGACDATGGLVFSAHDPPEKVVEQLAASAGRAFLLDVETGRFPLGGRFALDIRAALPGGAALEVRSPKALWHNPDGTPSPNHYRIRQGLDALRRAREAEADENLTRALHFVESATTEDSWNADAYSLAGRLAFSAGDAALAESYCNRGLAAGAADDRFLALYARVERRLGKSAEALPAVRARLGARAATAELKLEIARCLAAAGDYPRARETFGEVVSAGTDREEVRAEFGRLLEEMGDARAAREQFEAALARNPNCSAALLFFAAAALAEGKAEEAKQLSQRALAASPRDADAHAGAGKLYGAQQDWKAAAESYRISVTLAPDRRDLRDRYVDALSRAGQEGEAVAVLRRALEQDPDDVAAFKRLAEVQAATGELGEAVATLEGAAARGSAETHLLYRQAAELRERRGEYGQALLDYRAMLRSAPPERAPALRSDLSRHLASLSLLVNGERRLESNPLEKDLDLEPIISALAGKQEAMRKAEEGKPRPGLIAPGGITLLARTLGVEPVVLKDPDAVERMFSFILEANPQQSDRLQDNPIRRDAVAYLRSYDDLMRHMEKHHLLPKDFDPKQGKEFVFPLVGGPETLKSSQHFLAFFGVGMKSKRAPDGSFAVMLTLKQNRSTTPRQQMLRNMGVNLIDRNLREVRVTLGGGELPVLFDAETWTSRILPSDKNRSRSLLERLLLQSRAMRLYVALASCSEATRKGLAAAAAPGELIPLVDSLAAFGRYLVFRDDRLALPGSREAWEALLGAAGNPAALVSNLLRRDGGRALLLYAALSEAPKSVQAYLTASTVRLQNVYQMLGVYDGRGGGEGGGRFDLGRVLRQMTADNQGLLLDIDQRFARYVLADGGSGTPGDGVTNRMRLNETLLPRLMERVGTAAALQFSILDVVEFLKHLQASDPEMLDEKATAAIMRDPAQVPAMLDLVLDLAPQAPLLVKYLGYARDLAAAGARGWNSNRMRTSQSLVHLIALLHRQGALGREEGRKLLQSALDALGAAEEAAFALQTSAFLSNELMPAIEKAAGRRPEKADPVLAALAGPEQMREFAFEGKRLQLDAAAYKLQRMAGAVQHQRYTRLAELLEVFRLLRGLSSGPPEARLEELKKALSPVQTADLTAGQPGKGARAIAYVDLASLGQKVEAAVRGKSHAGLAQLASEIAAALDTELGVTLLTYCYAYHGAPEADALAFDANFIRKHDFFGSAQKGEGGWPTARLEQSETMGSYCVGSLSGLGFELSRLETAQSVQNFGRREGRGLVPTILSGMRVVRRSQRSDRAQEYVALTVRLAREILALTGLEGDLGLWCEDFLDTLVPPRRREQVLRLVREGKPQAAAEVLSPSELFFLGEAYRNVIEARSAGASDAGSGSADGDGAGCVPGAGQEIAGAPAAASHAPVKRPPELSGPVLQRLRQIVPAAEKPEFRVFRGEVEQYGMLMRRRIGISQVSLAVSDSYEHLERSVREEVLYERICDLKIRMAELNYALGLPAYLGEVEGELAIRDILPQGAAVRANSWKLALEQIARLETENARNWVDELLNRGILAIPAAATADKGGSSQP